MGVVEDWVEGGFPGLLERKKGTRAAKVRPRTPDHGSTQSRTTTALSSTELEDRPAIEGQNLTSPSASNRWTAVKAKLVRGPSLIPAENAGQTTGTSSAINQLIRIKSKATTDKKNFTGPELNAQLSSGSLAITIRSSAAVVIKHFAPLEAEFTRQSRYPYHSTPDNCAFLDFQGNA
ncbi:Phospholipase D1 [Puccinia graminis f. sp. tritici]|uniref:Phospholipase D1 n=1 Tax=Puccinia graminis f. sp. tritici TaxID=56615 RepID=A0A5B0RLC1_PUCGR|nr:Phospholipase D1 [Puccinia graminis f. sp. tritici]